MAIDDLWYKNAIIYCLDVEKYQDANGDGIGDFEGLMRRLDYLQGSASPASGCSRSIRRPTATTATTSPTTTASTSKHGSLGDFVDFMNHAEALGIRVHRRPGRQPHVDRLARGSSRRAPIRTSFFRDWYVWADERPKNHKEGIVFPGKQTTHLDVGSQGRAVLLPPLLRSSAGSEHLESVRARRDPEDHGLLAAARRLRLPHGRRAVPDREEGRRHRAPVDFNLLKEMRDFLQWRSGEAILLAEANVPPDESLEYFGDEGDRLQMMLNFPVNQRLFYALATGDLDPLIWALEQTRAGGRATRSGCSSCAATTSSISAASPTSSAQKVFDAFGPEKRMQLYDRGIRRRLAPMLGNDRRRLELAFSLLFSLPGTPMMQYGDEIGIGDDLRLPERECARTPMQWTADRHGGFSRARRVVRPGHQRRGLRLQEGERRRPAPRSAVAAELDGADDPRAQGMPGDQLGQLRRAAHERPRGARDALRLARYVTRDRSTTSAARKQKVKLKVGCAARRAARRSLRRPPQQGP